MLKFSRYVRVRIGLFLITVSSVVSGCATTHSSPAKPMHSEAKKSKSHNSIRPMSESYALLDDTSDVDKAILKRGARARGTDFGY